jgi:uncharacterized protein YndB with AHSA1/START domain
MNDGYTVAITVNRTPEEVYAAVTDVRAWWSGTVVGDTATAGSEFDYSYEDVHSCRIRVTSAVPGERVEWLVVESRFSFTEDPREWVGTRMVFDIAPAPGGTTLTFTHVGLVESHECYGVCVQGWCFYIQESLRRLIEGGAGRPATFDHRTNDGRAVEVAS